MIYHKELIVRFADRFHLNDVAPTADNSLKQSRQINRMYVLYMYIYESFSEFAEILSLSLGNF